MELRHLRYFVAVAEEGHITRAAERLGIQQPPLSQQIRAFEREIGEQLFRRKARGVELTDAGRALFAEARALLAQLPRAIESARRAARGEEGKLSIGFTSTAPFHPLVPDAIRRFREACPMVALTVEECLSNELVERLTSDRIDVAFIRTALQDTDRLTVVPLDDEPMVAALPSHHRAANSPASRPLRLEALADETFILAGPPGTGLHDAIIAACQAAGFNPRVGNLGASSPLAPRITSTLSLVAAGCGITCVPQSLQRFAVDGVVYRRIAGPSVPHAALSLAMRRGETSAIVRRFMGIVREIAKSVDRRSARRVPA
jgi:DNA-binding transcriptional LysR family regulator